MGTIDSEGLIPPIPRPLKRSASVASLPTPPRTRHRGLKRRGRSRGSAASDSDDGSGSDVAGGRGRIDTSDEEALEEEAVDGRKVHKRRRTKETADDEDAFWLGVVPPKSSVSDPEPETTTTRDCDGDHVPLIYQRLQQRRSKSHSDEKRTSNSSSASVVAPVSPPPSRRKPAASTSSLTLRTPSASPPSTPTKPKPKREPPPKVGRKTRRLVDELPVRDSPNNPFLDSPDEGGAKITTCTTDDGHLNLKSPRTPPPRTDEEKPTITYVFRGVRGVYPNPLYNHAKKRPKTPPPQSLLPPEHPDYSPDMRCPPRLLFPKTGEASNPSASDEDEDATCDAKETDQSLGQGPSTPTRTRTDRRPTCVGADKEEGTIVGRRGSRG